MMVTSRRTFNRGIRFINDRKQILLQDDVTGAGAEVQWRMQTNATITLGEDNKVANLELGGQKLAARILSPDGATFAEAEPVKLPTDPASPPEASYEGQNFDGNPDHPGVSVLTITMPSGTDFSLQVLFNPEYSGDVSLITPSSVPLGDWSRTSHNN